MWTCVVILVLITRSETTMDYEECHHDPAYDPGGLVNEIQFTWLGILQYIHIKSGNPHYSRTPRVVLVSPQYTICTTYDAAVVPKGYALGNVEFEEYERDEEECSLTIEGIVEGAACQPAVVVVPIADVILHPQFLNHGFMNTVALLKLVIPLRSRYMLPACLPLRNFLVYKEERPQEEFIMHLDFISNVPRDYGNEDKEVVLVDLLPNKDCHLESYTSPHISTDSEPPTVCTTGCGFVSGSPLIVRERTGFWNVVALAIGGPPCPDPLNHGGPSAPPLHIVIHPYLPWISQTVTESTEGFFDKNNPFDMLRTSKTNTAITDSGKWIGHWWLIGARCYRAVTHDLFKFYHEIFTIKPAYVHDLHEIYVKYALQLQAPRDTIILCLKINIPFTILNEATTPVVNGLNTSDVDITIPVLQIKHFYKMRVEAWGKILTLDD